MEAGIVEPKVPIHLVTRDLGEVGTCAAGIQYGIHDTAAASRIGMTGIEQMADFVRYIAADQGGVGGTVGVADPFHQGYALGIVYTNPAEVISFPCDPIIGAAAKVCT